MPYSPELVKALLGDKVAELFDGTYEVEPSKDEMLGNFKVGDKITFKFKNSDDAPLHQFVVTEVK